MMFASTATIAATTRMRCYPTDVLLTLGRAGRLYSADLIQRNVLVDHAAQGVDDGAVRHSRRRICVAMHLWPSAGKVKDGCSPSAVYCDR